MWTVQAGRGEVLGAPLLVILSRGVLGGVLFSCLSLYAGSEALLGGIEQDARCGRRH